MQINCPDNKDTNSNDQSQSMKSILNDLLELKRVMLEEIEQSTQKNEKGSETVDKLKYRIGILSSSYAQLLEESQNEKERLEKEVEKLKYRVEILKANISVSE